MTIGEKENERLSFCFISFLVFDLQTKTIDRNIM